MNTATIVVAAVGWILIGLLSGIWMARRGFDALWILLAAPLGPLFVPIAVERVRRRPDDAEATPSESLPAGTGPRILIGVDGSPESVHAMTTALHTLGSQGSVLVLAEVVNYEAAESGDGADMDAATRRLEAAANRVEVPAAVHTRVLVGAPGPALREFAARQGFDILVVGRRGRGLSRHVLGSVSTDLVTHSTVPVLVVEPQREE
ncbi:universal stress protein [Mycolicibacterium sp. 3033]|nr:universal stress protein [Mycolicibacterium aurantiacum]